MRIEEDILVKDERIMNLINSGLIRGEVRYDEPLSSHTSLKIGGRAEVVIFPEDPLSLKNILHAASGQGIPLSVIGAGTNLLVRDGEVGGITISLKLFGKMELTRSSDDTHVVLYVGAGVPLARVVYFAQKNGYSGIEALAGIPGSFGGAVYMNAGSFGTEMKDVVESVAIMKRDGELKILNRDQLSFTYRAVHLPAGAIILSANIALEKGEPEAVSKRTGEFMARKKKTQPLGELSAGCVFKNPEGDSAGRLIDAAGCKGMKAGDVEVSSVHANYFINRGRASFRDFRGLMKAVQARVREHSGIELEPEIRIIGND
jgi:UDP-N-acetylmuramate dehydrogenase